MIIVRNDIKVSQVEIVSKTVEQVFICIHLPKNNVALVGAVYIPPKSAPDVYLSHFDTVESVLHSYPSCHQFVLFGDYNIPDAIWSDGVILAPHNYVCGVFNEFLASSDLYQCNMIQNERGVLLDLVLSSVMDQEVYTADDHILPIEYHHPPLSTKLKLACASFTQQDTPMCIYDFINCDFFS